jgi:catechol 2,3-dioxygenase-like lactoylglutathione lyase family enzyme
MLALADVAVVVSDAHASAEWWKRNLGFASRTVGGSGHAVQIAPPGDPFVLHLCSGFAPLEPGDTGIAFVTDEIDRVVARMLGGKVVFPQPLTTEPWGKMAKFADPDGNVFWLMEAPTSMIRTTVRTQAGAARSRAPRRAPSGSKPGPRRPARGGRTATHRAGRPARSPSTAARSGRRPHAPR